MLLLGSAHRIHPEAPGDLAQSLHPHCTPRETEAGQLGESAYSLHVHSAVFGDAEGVFWTQQSAHSGRRQTVNHGHGRDGGK